MLAAALSAKGYETRVAYDAPAALRVAADFRPAIAFLDIGLPVMDGYELAARLRELPGLERREADRAHRIRAGIGPAEDAGRRIPTSFRQARRSRSDRGRPPSWPHPEFMTAGLSSGCGPRRLRVGDAMAELIRMSFNDSLPLPWPPQSADKGPPCCSTRF